MDKDLESDAEKSQSSSNSDDDGSDADDSTEEVVPSEWGEMSLGEALVIRSPRILKSLQDLSILKIYELLISESIFEIIVVETNRYAAQFKQNNRLKKTSRMNKWQDITVKEIKAFFGIILLMGLVRLPSLRHYWMKGDIYTVPIIKKCMTRDRFLIILKCLHFANNDCPTDSRAYKIENLFKIFNENCKTLLEPGNELVIDETMVPWKGRLSFKQYIKGKSSKYGVKLYKLCTTNGYCCETKIYTGKSSNRSTKDVGYAHQTVLEIMDNYLYSDKILYADNFYTSIPLAEE